MGPLIVCGMHRSGTSMLCRLLESLGLFVGHEKEHNHEALFFLELNQWILDQMGARWDRIENMRFGNPAMDDYVGQVLSNVLRGPSRKRFTGPDPQRLDLFVRDDPPAWGWKDPRNTFTALHWARLFPRARILHICRHPVDVAASLQRREQEILGRHLDMLERAPRQQLNGAMRLQQSPRLFVLDEGVALWKDYVRQALALEAAFSDKALRVRYEDFLDDPSAALGRIADFAGLDASAAAIEAAAAGVRSERAYAFLHRPELRAVHAGCRTDELVATLGYDRV